MPIDTRSLGLTGPVRAKPARLESCPGEDRVGGVTHLSPAKRIIAVKPPPIAKL
jgi:hypothetical protein